MKSLCATIMILTINVLSLSADPLRIADPQGGTIVDNDDRWERDYENSDNPNYQRRNAAPYERHEEIDLSRGQMDPGMKPDSDYYYPDYTHNNYYRYGN